MEQVNWDKIKEEKNLNIILGRAENQALDVLIRHFIKEPKGFFLESVVKSEAEYKKLTKLFFQWNCELQDKLLMPSPEDDVPSPEPKLSQNQKLCPNCNKKMPKSWKFHQECGWKGG